MDQNLGEFYRVFWRILTVKLHHTSNTSELIELKDHKIVYSGFITSLNQKLYGNIRLRGPHEIASLAAGWKATAPALCQPNKGVKRY